MSDNESQPLVYTIEEAARLLRIGRAAGYQAARAGQLPTIRVGRTLRVPRAALERLLDVKTEPEKPGSASGSGRRLAPTRHGRPPTEGLRAFARRNAP